MGEKAPRVEQDGPSRKENSSLSRRKLLGLGVVVAAGAAFGGATAERISAWARSKDLSKAEDFLRGKSKEKISIFGKELNHQQFAELVMYLADPPLRSQEELQELLNSFILMMELEDKYAGHLNVLPQLEQAEFIREKYGVPLMEKLGIDKQTLLLADTFGYGQIHPDTATEVAEEKADKFTRRELLSPKQLQELTKKDLPYNKTSEILGLTRNENLVFSFLSFYEGYNLYGRSTGGAVHGGLQWPEHRGSLQAVRLNNPRAFSLAITAYSAGLESPMAAKAQTYYNEICMANPSLAKRTGVNLLTVDGDIGGRTALMLEKLGSLVGARGPRELTKKPENFKEHHEQIIALDRWLEKVRPLWQRSMNDLLKQDFTTEKGTAALYELAQHRYHVQIGVYRLLKGYIPESKLHKVFYKYADTRTGPFLDTILSAQTFHEVTGKNNHKEFIYRLAEAVPKLVNFDERFKGYIPVLFRPAKQLGADPINMPARLLLTYELDSTSKSGLVRD